MAKRSLGKPTQKPKLKSKPSAPAASRHLGAIETDRTKKNIGNVRVDINVDDVAAMTQKMVDDVDKMSDSLEALRDTALATFTTALGARTSKHDQVEKCWEFHHDEVDPRITRDLFVTALELLRAGFYPMDKVFMVLDFAVRGPKPGYDFLLSCEPTRLSSVSSAIQPTAADWSCAQVSADEGTL